MKTSTGIVIAIFWVWITASLMIILSKINSIDEKLERIERNNPKTFSTPALQMHNAIQKYSKKWGIPQNIAYNVARLETGYMGPLHTRYKVSQISSADAIGPMQVMLETANWLRPKYGLPKISRQQLLNDININVETSMIVLYDRYKLRKNWKVTLGEYNTGKPIVNEYAMLAVSMEPTDYMIKP